MKKLFFCFFIIFCLFSALFFNLYGRVFLLDLGFVEEEIKIAGTGSMFPTFPKGGDKNEVVNAKEVVAWPKMRKYPAGIKVFGVNLFSYTLKRRDIVEIDNKETKTLSKAKYGSEAGFVKRIIALPGDRIELRDGFVYINGERENEPYTAKPRSTYGGDTLLDCKVLEIPPAKIFVMGDNRKASLDSRYELGLVDIKDIHFVMPWEKQTEYQVLWRDTANDASLTHTTTLDQKEFTNLLNLKRLEINIKPLNYVNQLSLSAKRRGKAMIDANDFSTDVSKSGITMAQAVKESGYKNIILAEVFTKGFYETDELLENFLEFPDTKKILLSSQYQDIGLSAVLGEIDNCPVQAVVAHLGGYVPPNYKKEDIESWQNLVDNLNTVIPSWETLRNADNVDKGKLEKLLILFNERKSNSERILSKMKANLWLTDEEEKIVEKDESLAKQANELISELNTHNP